MGRYDGEEYETIPACAPEDHRWGMNGTCFRCRRDRDMLVREAKHILVLVKQGKFGKYGG